MRTLARTKKENNFTACPYIESIWHYYRRRLVFRLSSTPKRLLTQTDNGIYA